MFPFFLGSVGANPCVRPSRDFLFTRVCHGNERLPIRAHTRVRPYIIKAAIAMCFSTFARSIINRSVSDPLFQIPNLIFHIKKRPCAK